MKKPWCIDPFIQMAHTADGYYRVCCIGEVDRATGPTTLQMTPLEYWNSAEAKQIRDDMLSGKFSEITKRSCAQCIANEESGIVSRRINENERYGLDRPKITKNIQKHIDNIDYDYSDLVYVNFKVLGNICNLKCLMCGPTASSKIAAENKRYFNLESPAELQPFTTQSKNNYFDELEKIIENIYHFNLVGGENIIHPNFPELFERFKKKSNIKEFELTIITNATEVPQVLLDDAHLFRKLTILVSIDGVGDRGSYVRSGLNWDTFDKNIKTYIEHPDINLHCIPAISMLNIGYIHEIRDYLETIGAEYDMSWNNLVTHPKTLRAINLPKSIKEQYIEQTGILDSNKWSNHKTVEPLKNILLSPQESPEQFLAGISKLKKIDEIRKTNLLDHFPEFEKWYNLVDSSKQGLRQR